MLDFMNVKNKRLQRKIFKFQVISIAFYDIRKYQDNYSKVYNLKKFDCKMIVKFNKNDIIYLIILECFSRYIYFNKYY